MHAILEDLLNVLDLERLEDNLFRGASRDIGGRSVFGGQVLGQSLVAAGRTVPEDRLAHSLHGYFLRPGDMKAPIVYDVDRIRDGRSFTTRRVVAIQHGKPIFNGAVSFQIEEKGVEHQAELPDVPGPEELKSERELRVDWADRVPETFREIYTMVRPIEIRPVNPQNPFEPEKRAPVKYTWFKAIDPLPDDFSVHQALLAYASDFSLMGTAMLPHRISFMQSNLQAASIDHAMWFHRRFRVDDWLLYAMDSPSASSSRGLNRGSIYSRDGVLVASTTQEGLMRLRRTEES